MSATTGPINVPAQGAHALQDELFLPVAANVKINRGALVVLSGGYAKPGYAATGLYAVGRAEENADNTAGAAGATYVTVRRGLYRYNNSASSDAIAQANVGQIAYIVDDQTVALTDGTGTRSPAGVVLAVDTFGVWVEIAGFLGAH